MNLKLDRIDNVCQQNVILARNIIRMSEDNELSANSLWYHNQGQIKRIQIHQNKFQTSTSEIEQISDHVHKAFQTFKKDIKNKNLNVYIAYRNILDQPMQADWNSFNLILFNLL